MLRVVLAEAECIVGSVGAEMFEEKALLVKDVGISELVSTVENPEEDVEISWASQGVGAVSRSKGVGAVGSKGVGAVEESILVGAGGSFLKADVASRSRSVGTDGVAIMATRRSGGVGDEISWHIGAVDTSGEDID